MKAAKIPIRTDKKRLQKKYNDKQVKREKSALKKLYRKDKKYGLKEYLK